MANIFSFTFFVCKKSMLHNYYIQNNKDKIQKSNKEATPLSSQFISIKVKEILRKSQAKIR